MPGTSTYTPKEEPIIYRWFTIFTIMPSIKAFLYLCQWKITPTPPQTPTPPKTRTGWSRINI